MRGVVAGHAPIIDRLLSFEAPCAQPFGHGSSELSLAQLKILPEGIAFAVFTPFVVFYLQQPLKLDHHWVALCILGAVYFVFRNQAL